MFDLIRKSFDDGHGNISCMRVVTTTGSFVLIFTFCALVTAACVHERKLVEIPAGYAQFGVLLGVLMAGKAAQSFSES